MSASFPEIPFNRPVIIGDEIEHIRQAFQAEHTSGDGAFTRRCAELLRKRLSVPEVLLTPSCTDALEMCAILLDLGSGDEVIVPSFSFVSTANAFVLRGVKPVFADIRQDTLNLDETRLEGLITERTRAIVVVHYAGVGCEMEAIREIASRHDVAVVEDNAHGLFATYRGAPLGTLGSLATLSFHETKNISCGEGGALLVNDRSHIERAEIVRDKGTNRRQLFRGEVDKYTWKDIGSSFVLSDILAAFLYAQLQNADRILARRRSIWERYDAGLRGRVERHGVRLPHVPDHCEQSYHMYYVILPSHGSRQALIDYLAARRISGVFHYTPLHTSGMGRAFGGKPGDCPVTEQTSDRLLRLPFFYALGERDQQRVIEAVVDFLE